MNTEYIITEIAFDDEMLNPQHYIIGGIIEKITVHPAQGEGDKYFWEVYFKDGRIEDIFNPRKVVRIPKS